MIKYIFIFFIFFHTTINIATLKRISRFSLSNETNSPQTFSISTVNTDPSKTGRVIYSLDPLQRMIIFQPNTPSDLSMTITLEESKSNCKRRKYTWIQGNHFWIGAPRLNIVTVHHNERIFPILLTPEETSLQQLRDKLTPTAIQCLVLKKQIPVELASLIIDFHCYQKIITLQNPSEYRIAKLIR